jgi:GTP-binding protein
MILDIRRDPNEGDMNFLNWLNHYGINSILVLTKADKLSRHQSISRAKLIGGQLEGMFTVEPTIFSAKTREGRSEIWGKINRVIETGNLQVQRP